MLLFLQIGWYSEDEGLQLSLNLIPTQSDDEEDIIEENIIDSIEAIEPVSSPLVNNNIDRSVHGRSFEQEQIDLITTIVAGKDMFLRPRNEEKFKTNIFHAKTNF